MSPLPSAFLSLSFSEILVLGLVAILVFGGRLPEVMRNLGRSYARFRHGMNDLTAPIRDEMRSTNIATRKILDGTRPTQGLPRGPLPDAPAPEDIARPLRGTEGDAAQKPQTPHPFETGGAADEPPPL